MKAFILFDVDGTLIHGFGIGRRALELAFVEVFSLRDVPDVRGHVNFNGALDPAIHAAIARLLKIRPETLAARRGELERAYVSHLRRTSREPGASRVLPGVEALLRDLHQRREVCLGLLTGNIEAGARVKLETHRLNRYFATGGFGGDGADRAEVARVAYGRLEALSGTTVSPSAVFVVGDSCRDVECGRANGFSTVAVATGWTSRRELEAAGPDLLLEDLSDADRFLQHVGLGQPDNRP
jgi:phosphoglycolate phosphatase-like HAD superfamily hydrolase